jgi:hypothetical protein
VFLTYLSLEYSLLVPISIKGTITKECLRHSLTWSNRILREYYRLWDEGYLKGILFKQNLIFWVTQFSKHTCTAWCADCLNTCTFLRNILDVLTKSKVTASLVVSTPCVRLESCYFSRMDFYKISCTDFFLNFRHVPTFFKIRRK